MKIKELIQNFDICAFIKVYACKDGTTWNDGGRPVFCGYPEDLEDNVFLWDKEIVYVTIDFDTEGAKGLVVEYRDDTPVEEPKTFTILHKEHLIHQFEVEANTAEEALEYFKDHMSEFDFSDGVLYESESEVKDYD